MVKSADDNLYPEIQNKNQDQENYHYRNVPNCSELWGFFPPSVLQVPQMMQCAQPHNIK